MAQVFQRERAAQIIAEAVMGGITATCDKYGISQRTFHRWRARLTAGDTILAEKVTVKMAALERDWAEELPEAIRAAIAFLKRSGEVADAKDPQAIHSVAGALKILTDVTLSRRLIDAKIAKAHAGISRPDGEIGEAPRPGASDSSGQPARTFAH